MTRDAEVEIEEDANQGLRELVREQIRQRRYEPAVRLEFAPGADARLRQMLQDRFALSSDANLPLRSRPRESARRRVLHRVGRLDAADLSTRVEVVTPVIARSAREKLWEILDVLLRDQRQAWRMDADGQYTQLHPKTPGDGPESLGTHEAMIALTRHRQALGV